MALKWTKCRLSELSGKENAETVHTCCNKREKAHAMEDTDFDFMPKVLFFWIEEEGGNLFPKFL